MASVAVTADTAAAAASRTSDLTDGSGCFAVEDLAPGPYVVTVWRGNREVGAARVTLPRPPGAAPLTLEVAADPAAATPGGGEPAGATLSSIAGDGGVIAGEVLDLASGQPLEGAVVAVWQAEVTDSVLGLTDAQGRFRVTGLSSGDYRLSCYYRLIGYGNIEVTREGIRVGPGATSRVELRLDTSVAANPRR
jgi:hypothetical protein